MLKGWSTTVTLGCIIIVGFIEAGQQALKDAPKVAALFPGWAGGGFWNYVPLLLLTVGAASWAIGRFIPTSPRWAHDEEWRVAFRKPHWEIVSGYTYANKSIEVDGKSFRDCAFERVTFMFHGNAPTEFVGNNRFSGGFSLDTENPAIMLFSKLQRFSRSIPGARIQEGTVDEKGNILADKFEIRQVSPETVKAEVTASDPRINLSIKDERAGGYPQTPFILHNQGKEVAHRVQIQPINFRSGAVTFDVVDSIAPDADATVLPNVTTTLASQSMVQHNIGPLLHDEWNSGGGDFDALNPVVVGAAMTYGDFTLKPKFETAFEIAFWGLRDHMKVRHPHLHENEPSIEIKNVSFKRLS